MKIITVAGARPNFMKIAPLCKELKNYPSIKHTLVHTGQHYDYKMSQVFFQELEIPKPDINLEAGSGSHTSQTAEIMLRFEKVLTDVKPDMIVVVGDVNSTLACSLTAVKMLIPVAHIEAGLRSFDRTMPEEINRIVTDSISDLLFTSCADADNNLTKEGIPKSKVFFVGNIMIDSLLNALPMANENNILERLGVSADDFCLVTLHRPGNVDEKSNLAKILNGLGEVSRLCPVIYPCHPRTMKNIQKFKLLPILRKHPDMRICDPVGYMDFVNLTEHAEFVLTDSGGIQEETTVLGVPCLTLRDNTERPVTVTMGTNRLIGSNPDNIVPEALKTLEKPSPKKSRIPPKWDGKTAERICRILAK